MAIRAGNLAVGDIRRSGSCNDLHVVVEVIDPHHIREMTLLGIFMDHEKGVDGELVRFIDRASNLFTSAGEWPYSFKDSPSVVMTYHSHQVDELQANWARIQAQFPDVGECPFPLND